MQYGIYCKMQHVIWPIHFVVEKQIIVLVLVWFSSEAMSFSWWFTALQKWFKLAQSSPCFLRQAGSTSKLFVTCCREAREMKISICFDGQRSWVPRKSFWCCALPWITNNNRKLALYLFSLYFFMSVSLPEKGEKTALILFLLFWSEIADVSCNCFTS